MKRIPLNAMTPADLDALYERAEHAEETNRRITNYTAPRIRRALESLPAQCRYHGDRLDPDHLSWGREACCDTGEPALRRRVALEALTALTNLAPPARGGIVRTPAIVGETVDCGPVPTRTDTARTRPDTDTADTGPGVRVEYRATVPRHLVGAALAEALHAIDRATSTDTTRTPPDTDTPDSVRTPRRTETSAAISRAFDIPGDLTRPT
ncbi:hypothetical protein ABTZ57_37975 [Streptomyces sp. NPDC094048]|uniref:hypothetical protein n=1 Tax=Streptomyces sp. NPDC094048 TaxID=3155207 RepID=UPI003323575D